MSDLDEAVEHLGERLDACKRGPGGIPQSLTDHAIEIVLVELAEHRRLQTLGGPPPPVDKTWANADLPAPETANDPHAPRLRR